MDFKCLNFCILWILKNVLSLLSFICICILCHTSKKNPFENHIIGNLSNYFYEVPISNDISYNNSLNNRLSTREYLLNVSKNMYSDLEIKNKLILRKLVSQSDCLEIVDKFERFIGKKLSNIFDFNYNKIHNISIAILVISCIFSFFSIIFYSCIYILLENNWKTFINLFSYFIIILSIAEFILSIILFYFMEKSDLEKYDNFLDCKNVKTKVFKKISDINKMRKCFYVFVILKMVELGINKFEDIIEYGEKIEENLKKEIQEKQVIVFPNQNIIGSGGNQLIVPISSQNIIGSGKSQIIVPISTQNIIGKGDNQKIFNPNDTHNIIRKEDNNGVINYDNSTQNI